MSLRRKIALWLCPELWHETDESWRFRVHIEDYQRWLREYPEVAQVLKSLRAEVLGGEPVNAGAPVGDEVCTIGGLRTQLLRMQQTRPAVHVGERIIPDASNLSLLNALKASQHACDAAWRAEVLEQLKALNAIVVNVTEGGNAMRVVQMP